MADADSELGNCFVAWEEPVDRNNIYISLTQRNGSIQQMSRRYYCKSSIHAYMEKLDDRVLIGIAIITILV